MRLDKADIYTAGPRRYIYIIDLTVPFKLRYVHASRWQSITLPKMCILGQIYGFSKKTKISLFLSRKHVVVEI